MLHEEDLTDRQNVFIDALDAFMESTMPVEYNGLIMDAEDAAYLQELEQEAEYKAWLFHKPDLTER